jgi:hypothetical protein
MKTFKFLFATLAIVFASTMQAQISVNVNIGTRPAWGPVVAPEVRYYYLPDVEVYYDIPSSMYIFFDGGRWIHRRQLPARYRNYDLHRGRKIVVDDYRGDSPYTHCKYQYKHDNGYDRRERGERDEREAYVVKRHDNERGHWKNEDHDNGRGHGNGKHKGRED